MNLSKNHKSRFRLPCSRDGFAKFNTGFGWVLFVCVTWLPLHAADGQSNPAETPVVMLETNVPQFAPDPIVFDQSATEDNLVVLMAAASGHDSQLTAVHSGANSYPKHFGVGNWKYRGDYMKWNIALATGAVYHVYAKLSARDCLPLRLNVEGDRGRLEFTTRNIGWDKLDAGLISLPAGTNQLMLRRNTDATNGIQILSLELIRESDRAGYERRVADFRADTTWLSQSKYGLMLQFGPWGFPPSGDQKPLDIFANDFDVRKFVNLVTNTGARYVVWSMTWWTYQMCAPIKAVDRVVGNHSRTSQRDVVGELTTALHQAGVRFMLYYHTGQDSHLGYGSTDWWRAQRFPEPDFSERAGGDRSVFFTNWINVISEIGNRYGTNLDGWFFDDGVVYYPAPFERMGRAAKAGNRNRLVSYNQAVSDTDFQELHFGENSHGEERFGSASAGGGGIFSDGPFAGLLQHGMFRMEQDWGVHSPQQPIKTRVTTSQAVGWVRNASARGVPLSFNLMMWENQRCSASSLSVLENLKQMIYGGEGLVNLVVNGDFESPPLKQCLQFGPGSTKITGWTVTATPPDGVQVGAPDVLGNDGTQTLQLTGGVGYAKGGGISQTIHPQPGLAYIVSIDAASRQNNPITGDFNFGGSHHLLTVSSKAFTTFTWPVVATDSNTLIRITGCTNSDRGQLIIDNVSVCRSPVPTAAGKAGGM